MKDFLLLKTTLIKNIISKARFLLNYVLIKICVGLKNYKLTILLKIIDYFLYNYFKFKKIYY